MKINNLTNLPAAGGGGELYRHILSFDFYNGYTYEPLLVTIYNNDATQFTALTLMQYLYDNGFYCRSSKIQDKTYFKRIYPSTALVKHVYYSSDDHYLIDTGVGIYYANIVRPSSVLGENINIVITRYDTSTHSHSIASEILVNQSNTSFTDTVTKIL